ncbi:hypothetical protein ACFVZC_33035 [Streptomyces marokkonensis]|uniref:Uncharacterized protein n=1 Tax=Streptomyces marokkonensis TaxID=324855 RepID=A0ABW6QGA1_9ACTN
MLAGPLPGTYDPSGPNRLLFAFFAAMAETKRENIRESILEGLDAARPQGTSTAAGRPSSPTTCCTPCCGGARTATWPNRSSRPDHPTGKRKGQASSVASIYRAPAEHEKKQAYPKAVAAAHADFADLQDADDIPPPSLHPAAG